MSWTKWRPCMSNTVEYLGNMQLKSLSPPSSFAHLQKSWQLMGLCNMKHITSHFPLSPAELASCWLCWRQGPVSTFFHLCCRFRTGSGAQTLVWPAESNSLVLESGKGESTEGVRGWVGSEDGRARLLEEEELQQQLRLLVLCGCSHNGVQSSEPSYTPTPRAVWQNRLCEGGLEDWAYKGSRATFLSFYAAANLCPKRKKKKIHNGSTKKVSLKSPHLGLLDFRCWKPGSGM